MSQVADIQAREYYVQSVIGLKLNMPYVNEKYEVMVLRVHCQEPWFSKIKSGVKRIEGRKYSPKYSGLKTGELLEFYCNTQNFIAEVIEVKSYKTLEEYLKTEGYQYALPGVNSFQEAVEVYLQYNSREELNKADGFLAIHIKVKC